MLEFLENCYMSDMYWLTRWYMWIFLFPGLLYVVFMIIKWTVLTIPVWVPVTTISWFSRTKGS